MKHKHGHDLEYLARECGSNIEISREELNRYSEFGVKQGIWGC